PRISRRALGSFVGHEWNRFERGPAYAESSRDDLPGHPQGHDGQQGAVSGRDRGRHRTCPHPVRCRREFRRSTARCISYLKRGRVWRARGSQGMDPAPGQPVGG
ncbi:unnamed protein product, partial [Ectocarpus sp. 13 AM-2016]